MSNSSYEKILATELRKHGIKFEREYKVKIGGKWHRVDFFIKPNICIEVDGEIFHNFPYGKTSDYLQTSWLKANGYKVLRFWGRNVLDNPSGCVMAIKNIMPLKQMAAFRFFKPF